MKRTRVINTPDSTTKKSRLEIPEQSHLTPHSPIGLIESPITPTSTHPSPSSNEENQKRFLDEIHGKLLELALSEQDKTDNSIGQNKMTTSLDLRIENLQHKIKLSESDENRIEEYGSFLPKNTPETAEPLDEIAEVAKLLTATHLK